MQWRRYNDLLNQIEHRKRERRVPVEAEIMEIELYHVTSMYVSQSLWNLEALWFCVETFVSSWKLSLGFHSRSVVYIWIDFLMRVSKPTISDIIDND